MKLNVLARQIRSRLGRWLQRSRREEPYIEISDYLYEVIQTTALKYEWTFKEATNRVFRKGTEAVINKKWLHLERLPDPIFWKVVYLYFTLSPIHRRFMSRMRKDLGANCLPSGT